MKRQTHQASGILELSSSKVRPAETVAVRTRVPDCHRLSVLLSPPAHQLLPTLPLGQLCRDDTLCCLTTGWLTARASACVWAASRAQTSLSPSLDPALLLSWPMTPSARGGQGKHRAQHPRNPCASTQVVQMDYETASSLALNTAFGKS